MDRDKNKDNEIFCKKLSVLNLSKRGMRMAENDSELLNTVYREISERLGINAAMTIYEMLKGQQISFPTRFFDSSMIHQAIIQEYDGTNIRVLAVKYNYSEKTIRRIIKENIKK